MTVDVLRLCIWISVPGYLNVTCYTSTISITQRENKFMLAHLCHATLCSRLGHPRLNFSNTWSWARKLSLGQILILKLIDIGLPHPGSHHAHLPEMMTCAEAFKVINHLTVKLKLADIPDPLFCLWKQLKQYTYRRWVQYWPGCQMVP